MTDAVLRGSRVTNKFLQCYQLGPGRLRFLGLYNTYDYPN